MKTIVITGGTSGIGRELGLRLVERGHRVVVVGSGGDRGFRAAAGERGSHLRADLSSVRETRRVVAELRAEHPVIDALVLGAFRFNTDRVETPEGFEHTFALYALSRYLLAEGLSGPLAGGMILNLCGVGGIKAGALHWDDLQLRRGHSGFKATMQGARINDLLGAAYARRHPDVSYVLYNPLFVNTGLADPFKQPVRGLVKVLAALFATSPGKAAVPMLALLDAPPATPLAAYRAGKPIGFTPDHEAADRLYGTLAGLVGLD